MTRLATIVGLALASNFVAAQNLPDYLKIRNAFKITEAYGEAALETFIGKRVFEVRGTVSGVIGSSTGGSLVLDSESGQPIFVKYTELPEWLHGATGSTRIIVRAERAHETAELNAILLAAHPDEALSKIEEKKAKAIAEANAAKAKRASTSTSRGTPVKRNPAEDFVVGSVAEALPYYVSFIKSRNKRLPDSEALRIGQGILGFSVKYGVDARLIMAMVMVESGFDPNAVSYAGAQGLGQLMPGTARGMGVSNSFDSIDNLQATVRLVRGHLDKYTAKTGDDYQGLVLMLAAYNAGSGAVRRHGGVPPYKQTQNHIKKVVDAYLKFCGK